MDIIKQPDTSKLCYHCSGCVFDLLEDVRQRVSLQKTYGARFYGIQCCIAHKEMLKHLIDYVYFLSLLYCDVLNVK